MHVAATTFCAYCVDALILCVIFHKFQISTSIALSANSTNATASAPSIDVDSDHRLVRNESDDCERTVLFLGATVLLPYLEHLLDRRDDVIGETERDCLEARRFLRATWKIVHADQIYRSQKTRDAWLNELVEDAQQRDCSLRQLAVLLLVGVQTQSVMIETSCSRRRFWGAWERFN